MSATTMAVATTTETLDPSPGSRLGQAAPPVSDAAMSVHALGRARHARFFSSCRLAAVNSSNVNNDLNLGPFRYPFTWSDAGPLAALRKERGRPTIRTRFRVLWALPD